MRNVQCHIISGEARKFVWGCSSDGKDQAIKQLSAERMLGLGKPGIVNIVFR